MFPLFSEHRIFLLEIIGSDVRQLPIGFLYQGIQENPIGFPSEIIGFRSKSVGSYEKTYRIWSDPTLRFFVLGSET